MAIRPFEANKILKTYIGYFWPKALEELTIPCPKELSYPVLPMSSAVFCNISLILEGGNLPCLEIIRAATAEAFGVAMEVPILKAYPGLR